MPTRRPRGRFVRCGTGPLRSFALLLGLYVYDVALRLHAFSNHRVIDLRLRLEAIHAHRNERRISFSTLGNIRVKGLRIEILPRVKLVNYLTASGHEQRTGDHGAKGFHKHAYR